MRRFNIKRGDSGFLFVFSLINFFLYGVWFVAYIICLMLRASAFSSAQSTMALSGQMNYTVEVSSPFFAVLRVILYVLPAFIIAWLIALKVCDHKRMELCDNKIILAVFGIDAVCALMSAFDMFASHMIF